MPLLIVLATLAAFFPALQNEFLSWDDDTNFLDNPHYRGLTWRHLRWMWTTFHLGHYVPLTWMSLGVDYMVWGMNPVGYHLTNVLVHVANALLFYVVACRILTLARPGGVEQRHAVILAAGFAALLFALHPLRVESVAWVTERRDVLSGLFYLLTLLVYLRHAEGHDRRRWWYWLSVVLFGCALLSKSMAVSLAVVVLILDVYPLRRLGGPVGWWNASARHVYVEKIPFVLLAGIASAIAFKAQFQQSSMASLTELSPAGRLAVSAYGLSFYLWKTIVPFNLSPLYPLPPSVDPFAAPFIVSYAVVLGITAIAWATRQTWPGVAASWLAFIAVLLPVIGIFQNGPQITADRYTYLAGFGWATLAGGALFVWRQYRTLLKTSLALVVVVALAVLSWNQAQVWHDSERLWTYALSIDPNSANARNNFGYALARQGKLAEATEYFEQALRINPRYAVAHNNQGWALGRQGQLGAAIEHFQAAVRLRPEFASAHHNWGVALTRQGRLDEAIEHFEQALRLNPDFAEAHNDLGIALARQHKLSEAIEHFDHALRLRPDLIQAQNNRRRALTLQGTTETSSR